MSTDDSAVETDDLGPETTVYVTSWPNTPGDADHCLHLDEECLLPCDPRVYTTTTIEQCKQSIRVWCDRCAEGVEDTGIPHIGPDL